MFQLLLLWLFTASWWPVYRIYFSIDLHPLIGAVHHFPLVHAKPNRGESGDAAKENALRSCDDETAEVAEQSGSGRNRKFDSRIEE